MALMRSTAVVAAAGKPYGVRIAVEWPRQCEDWQSAAYKAFAAEHGLITVELDGCMFGLVAEGGRNDGTPIKKPWRIDTNCSTM